MKKFKGIKFLSLALSLAVLIGTVPALSTSAFAAGPLTEFENIDTANLFSDDSYTDAQVISSGPLLDKTYSYVQGGFYGASDLADCYLFGLGSTSGSKGRVAIKLEGIPFGHDYNLELLDQNGNIIAYSRRAGNTNEIIRTPVVTAYTNYYVRVIPVNVPNYENSTYRIIFDTNIVTETKTSSLTPTTLNSTSDTWSTDAYVNNSTLPADAKIVSAKVQAQRSTVNNATLNQLRVKVGSGAYQTVTWKSGDVDVPDLVGQNASGYWYAGFEAKELAVIIGGQVVYLGIVSMNNFKLTVQYEYDRYLNY